jgi:hypothetical protein
MNKKLVFWCVVAFALGDAQAVSRANIKLSRMYIKLKKAEREIDRLRKKVKLLDDILKINDIHIDPCVNEMYIEVDAVLVQR